MTSLRGNKILSDQIFHLKYLIVIELGLAEDYQLIKKTFEVAVSIFFRGDGFQSKINPLSL